MAASPVRPGAARTPAPSGTASPCRRLCTLDEHDVCVGCGRTLAEITGWTQMSEPERQACVAVARQRRMARRDPRV